MAESTSLKQHTILVEFAPSKGKVQQVSLSAAELSEQSTAALEKAMETIKDMAQRTFETVDAIANRPTQVNVQFGIKLEAEAGALIAKTGAEASINVTLTWNL